MDLASAIRFFVRQTRTDVKGAGKQTFARKTVDTHNFALAFLMRNVFVQTCKLASILVLLDMQFHVQYLASCVLTSINT